MTVTENRPAPMSPEDKETLRAAARRASFAMPPATASLIARELLAAADMSVTIGADGLSMRVAREVLALRDLDAAPKPTIRTKVTGA